MHLLIFILILFKAIRILYYLQLKEYRFDRLFDFIRYDQGFLKLFTIPDILAFIGLTFYLFNPNQYVWLVSWIIACFNFFYARVKFIPTTKATLIYIAFSFIQIFLFFYLKLPILSYFLVQPLLFLIVTLLTPITIFLKNRKVKLAQQKISKFPNLKVIAITGSYGKSSTKEFLADILGTKFKVLKTPKNINTEIGIANVILSELNEEHEIFIVEAGAYKIGEIAKSMQMLSVDYAVLTAIIEQHLTLFGSLNNIRLAKSEIANTLKPEGKLYLNMDSPEMKKVLSKFKNKHKTKTYGSDLITKLKQSEASLSFSFDGETYKAPIYGPHNAINLSVCIKIAKDLGFNQSEIKSALFKINNPEFNLHKIVGKNGATIFDDSYNSNLDGFLAAINLIKTSLKPNKVLITMGVLELGPKTEVVHKQIAQAADEVFDHIFLVKPSFAPYFQDLQKAKLHIVHKPDQLIKDLNNLITSDTVVLIENRVNPKVKKFLLS